MSGQNLETKLALLEQSIEYLKEELEQIKKDKEDLRKECDELKAMATRWKGFGAALMALGGGVGFFLTQFDHLKSFLGFVKPMVGH